MTAGAPRDPLIPAPAMTPEEFERLKEEEKKHLRELRALRQQHREVERKKSVLDALRGMTRPDLDRTHDDVVGKLMGEAAHAEARLDLAMEQQPASSEPTEAEREALRRAEAEALVRRMKEEAAAGTPGGGPPGPAAKTLGRGTPPDEPAPPPGPAGGKTIGRPRSGG